MEKFMKIKEISEVLRIGPHQLREWAKRGLIPSYKISGAIIFDPKEVEEYIRKTHRLEQKQSA